MISLFGSCGITPILDCVYFAFVTDGDAKGDDDDAKSKATESTDAVVAFQLIISCFFFFVFFVSVDNIYSVC